MSFRESLLAARGGRGEAVELEVEDGTGAWRCTDVIVEAEAEAETEGEGVEEVEVRDTAEVTGAVVDESGEGRWPLTSEGLFMAQGKPNQGPWGKGSCAMRGLDIVTPCCRLGKSDWASGVGSEAKSLGDGVLSLGALPLVHPRFVRQPAQTF